MYICTYIYIYIYIHILNEQVRRACYTRRLDETVRRDENWPRYVDGVPRARARALRNRLV